MKPTRRALALAAATALSLVAVSLAVSKTGVLYVQVKQGEVRASASPLGNVVGTVTYGQDMTVLEEKGAWIKVTGAGMTGWMHTSALTKDKVKMQAGQGDAQVKASSGEQSLAGKGFTKEMESAFRDKNKTADFAAVDKMETYKVSRPQSLAFVQQGSLKMNEGGAR